MKGRAGIKTGSFMFAGAITFTLILGGNPVGALVIGLGIGLFTGLLELFGRIDLWPPPEN